MGFFDDVLDVALSPIKLASDVVDKTLDGDITGVAKIGVKTITQPVKDAVTIAEAAAEGELKTKESLRLAGDIVIGNVIKSG